MDQTDRVLLDLIKSSLWNTGLPDYDSIYGEPVDWEQVFKESKIQTIAGLLCPALPGSVPEQVMSQWKNYSYKILVNFHKVLAVQDDLMALLSEHNIPAAILKGSAAAIYYPVPNRRNMGDIDFIVPQELYDKTEELLKENGYTMTQERINNYRHSGFDKDGVHIELHHHFSHYDAVDIEQYIIDGLYALEERETDGHRFKILPSLANGMVLLDHMRNHLQSGLGFRQVIDWMVYVHTTVDESFWNASLGPAIRAAGMEKLAVTATKMCRQYLGLPDEITWCDGAEDDLASELLEMILECGNFGRKKGTGNMIEAVSTSMRRIGIFRRLQFAGESNWEAYKKHPWLKPFCWIYQIFRYIRQTLKTRRTASQVRADISQSKKKAQLLKKLGI